LIKLTAGFIESLESMIKRVRQFSAFIVLSIYSFQCWSQVADTVKRQLDEVVITGYLSRQPIAQVPGSAAVLDSKTLLNGSQQSLLPVVNIIPGVRMEERSPGSYRLSIRGSLLRSPFGVRNVKMYLNDLPFTDASGNTYLNLIDPILLQRIEILKGPDGSLFGANSGGVVLLDTDQNDSSSVRGGLSGGSYGLFREHVLVSNAKEKFRWNFGEAFQRSDGYRQQSAMKRLSLFGLGKLKYGISNSLTLTALFSDLHYETPGGLTEDQYEDDPQQARPATATAPGARTQQAGIYNTTFFGGLTNELNLSSSIRHIISVFGTHTEYENPFITNYEIRREKNAGLRTFLHYSLAKNEISLQAHAGVESQFGSQKISNYENDGGERDSLMSHDEVDIFQAVYFSKLTLEIADRLTTEIAVSLNQYQYTFTEKNTRKLSNEWMPRIAVSYRITPAVALRASVSRGYSPPTIAEIRPSGGVINETLEAESGWNKEIGTRLSIWNGRLEADASVFRYDLTNAIVRRTGEDDTEYFLNSGGTKQTGAEFLISTVLVPEQNSTFVQRMSFTLSYAYSRFYFDQYSINAEDYSGNRLTGVPRSNIVAGLSTNLTKRVHVFIQSTFVSRIPLNDANSEYTDHYELLQAKISWIGVKKEGLALEFFAGADNLLNQKYSLGNDLNAFRGRYYNAAPLRNFYGGIHVRF
jgi:iron complex outermembrane receptor protein